MSEFKVGTRVECKAFGKGTVIGYIDETDTSYYIKVRFDNKRTVNCSKDGYIEFTKNCPPYTVKAITEECKTDKINPNYYKGNIECIEAIKASMTCEEHRGFLTGHEIHMAIQREGRCCRFTKGRVVSRQTCKRTVS